MNNINAHRYNYNSKVNNKRHRNENGRKKEPLFFYLLINDYCYVLSMFFFLNTIFSWTFRFDYIWLCFSFINLQHQYFRDALICTYNIINIFHQINIKLYDFHFSMQRKINVFFYMCNAMILQIWIITKLAFKYFLVFPFLYIIYIYIYIVH